MIPSAAILLWRLLAAVSLALGAVGLVLPVLPTVPFILVAAWAGSRGWPQLEKRLLAHARYGPLIVRWRQSRAVPRSAKWAATLGMTASGVILLLSQAPNWLQLLGISVMLGVGIWLWRRPDS